MMSTGRNDNQRYPTSKPSQLEVNESLYFFLIVMNITSLIFTLAHLLVVKGLIAHLPYRWSTNQIRKK